MDVEALTDEIPSCALSCSPLIELSNLQEECWEFSIPVEAEKIEVGANLDPIQNKLITILSVDKWNKYKLINFSG